MIDLNFSLFWFVVYPESVARRKANFYHILKELDPILFSPCRKIGSLVSFVNVYTKCRRGFLRNVLTKFIHSMEQNLFCYLKSYSIYIWKPQGENSHCHISVFQVSLIIFMFVRLSCFNEPRTLTRRFFNTQKLLKCSWRKGFLRTVDMNFLAL